MGVWASLEGFTPWALLQASDEPLCTCSNAGMYIYYTHSPDTSYTCSYTVLELQTAATALATLSEVVASFMPPMQHDPRHFCHLLHPLSQASYQLVEESPKASQLYRLYVHMADKANRVV